MAIRVSSAKQVDALTSDLGSHDAVARAAAAARLIVIGARAVDRLLAAAQSDAPAGLRIEAWRALDGIGDARTLEPALRALDDRDPAVAVAAAAAVRRFVRGADGAAAVDRLSAIVLDRRRPDVVRAAALRALDDLGPKTTAPLRRSVASDPGDALRAESSDRRSGSRARASAGYGVSARSPERLARRAAFSESRLRKAAEQSLPDDPVALRRDILEAAGEAAPEILVHLIDRIREREGAEAPATRPAWMLARAAAHLALARRGSRLALYDLRETVESARAPLPVEVLQAIVLVGDPTLLEPVAAAHTRAADPWSRRHLAEAFYAIVNRERLTARSR